VEAQFKKVTLKVIYPFSVTNFLSLFIKVTMCTIYFHSLLRQTLIFLLGIQERFRYRHN